MGGPRGRRITPAIRQECLLLIKEATSNGCRLKSACEDLGVDFKTINRWRVSIEDARRGPITAPGNKLTDAEKEAIIEVSTSSAYRDLSPWQIVARLADSGNYIASESSFYKVLKEKELLEHRGRSKKPVHNSLRHIKEGFLKPNVYAPKGTTLKLPDNESLCCTPRPDRG